jgi:hypothetical protein
MTSANFVKFLPDVVTNLENMLTKWQTLVKDEQAKAPRSDPQVQLSHGDLFKLLIVECQELLYMVQKTMSVVDPSTRITYRHSNALP